jgi:hypothetical protein
VPRAVAVLFVATLCPLILAAPVALVSGLSAAARRGIVVKNGGVLERLTRCTAVLLDKTGVAAAGFLPAVWGALLQRGHRHGRHPQRAAALRPVAAAASLASADAALTQRFRAEHQFIRGDIEQLRTAADVLTTDPRAVRAAMARVRRVHALLTGEIWAHESAEESDLYPALDRLLGGADPTATISRAHAEIAYKIARLGRLIADIGDRVPGEADVADLRGTLYSLHAILRLYTMQKDEAYLSLGDDVETVGGGRP